MKMTSGVARQLSDPAAFADPRPAPRRMAATRPAAASERQRPRAKAAPRTTGPGRPVLGALAAGVSAALLGCASVAPTGWRVEPAYRLDHGGAANASAAYLAMARQYEGESRDAQALLAYRRAALAAPDDADVQQALGLALARHGQLEQAVAALRRAVVLSPASAPMLNNLGYALLLSGRAAEATPMFRLALAVDPAHQQAARNLAEVTRQLAKEDAPAAAVQAATVPADIAPVAPVSAVPAGEAAAAVSIPSAPMPASDAPAVGAAPPAPEHEVAGPALGAARVGAKVSSMPRALPMEGVRIELVNGNGANGLASRVRRWLNERGVHGGRLANLPPYKIERTVVIYKAGQAEAARELARRMPVAVELVPARSDGMRADLKVVLGHDARRPPVCAAWDACPPPERVAAAGR